MNTHHGRRRRKPVSRDLAPRSMRSLEEACRLADLPMPGTAAALTEAYLRLLVEGLDHEEMGDRYWLDAIGLGAPPEATRGYPRVS